MDGLRMYNSSLGAAKSAADFRESTTIGKNTQIPNAGSSIGSTQAKDANSFSTTLKDAINSVDKLAKDADQKMQAVATGKSQNLHETMIASEKADIALRLMVQMRNKIVEAYQEIMKMQV